MSGNGSTNNTDFYSLRTGNKLKAIPSLSNSEENLNLNEDSARSSEIEDNYEDTNSDSIVTVDDSIIFEENNLIPNLVNNSNSHLSSLEENQDNLSFNWNIESSKDNSLEMGTNELNMFDTLKFIPEFDGSPSKLHQFLQCCDIIFNDLKVSEHIKFLQLMKKILTGKAYDETVKHKNYKTWSELKKDLETRYKDVRSKLQISQELSEMRQKYDEDVRSYGSRVQELLFQLNDICVMEAGAGSEVIVEKINSQTALVAFQEGLNNNIRIVVKSHHATNLNDSIKYALEEEALFKRHIKSDEYKIKFLKCQICKKKGHTADRCYQFRPKINSEENFNSNLTIVPTLNKNHSIICSYCKKSGHHIEKCYSRINAEKRKNDNDQKKNKSDMQKLNVVDVQDNASGNGNGLVQSLSNRPVRARDI